MCNLLFFHPGDLGLSDWFWILLTFIGYSFIIYCLPDYWSQRSEIGRIIFADCRKIEKFTFKRQNHRNPLPTERWTCAFVGGGFDDFLRHQSGGSVSAVERCARRWSSRNRRAEKVGGKICRRIGDGFSLKIQNFFLNGISSTFNHRRNFRRGDSLFISRTRRRVGLFGGDGIFRRRARNDAPDGVDFESFCRVNRRVSILQTRTFRLACLFIICRNFDSVCVYRRNDSSADFGL